MAGRRHVLERRLKMRTLDDPVRRAVLNVQVAAAHTVEDFEAATETEGLSLAVFNVLRILRGHPEGHPRSAINERLVYRKADVTRLIDRLERRGLVERVRDERDRRLSITRITPKGVKVLARLDPLFEATIDTYRPRLTPREFAELNRLLERLYAHKVD